MLSSIYEVLGSILSTAEKQVIIDTGNNQKFKQHEIKEIKYRTFK